MKKEIARRQFLKQTALGTVMGSTAAQSRKPAGVDVSGHRSPANYADGVGSGRAPFVEPIPMLSGAILADSFDGSAIDANVWLRPNWMVENDPHIAVGIEHGRLRISGHSHPSGKENQYVGVISKYFRETDVILVVRMRVRTLFEKEGRIRHIAHLCTGDWPDFFMEINFGTTALGLPARWFSSYVNRIWNYPGYSSYLEPTLAAVGDEAKTWNVVAIKHDGVTQETQSYLIEGGKWKPVGPSKKLHFNHAHVELKVDVGIPGVNVDMDFDDARLYLNPAHNPAMIVISSPVVKSRPEIPIHDLDVYVFDEESGRLLGKGRTDEGGQAPVLLETGVLYPASARIEVRNTEGQVLQSKIPRFAVRGLYPGDVWVLRFPSKG